MAVPTRQILHNGRTGPIVELEKHAFPFQIDFGLSNTKPVRGSTNPVLCKLIKKIFFFFLIIIKIIFKNIFLNYQVRVIEKKEKMKNWRNIRRNVATLVAQHEI
jgi:hypothetical protein